MAFKAYKPQKVEFRTIQKMKNNKNLDPRVVKALNYNPWQSVYKEDFMKSNKNKVKNGYKKMNMNEENFKELKDNISVESFKVKKNFDNVKKNNFIQNNNNNSKISNLRPQSSYMKETRNSKVSKNLNNNVKIQNEPIIISHQGNKSKIINQNKVLNKESKIIKNQCKIESNMLGQKSVWLNKEDNKKNPAYSKMMIDDKKNFIETNMPILIADNNEYFSGIFGKCICGTCICGKCKCVHPQIPLKEKFNNNSVYQNDYLKFPLSKTNKYGPLNKDNLGVIKNQKGDFLSNNKKDFMWPKEEDYGNTQSFKPKNMFRGPKAPTQKMSQYKMDYPGWGVVPPTDKIQPFVPTTTENKLPFYGNCSNRNYGNFFVEGHPIYPTESFKKPDQRNPLGCDMKPNFSTTNGNAYVKHPKENIIVKKPKDNLGNDGFTFANNYIPISKDYDGKENRKCPAREIINYSRLELQKLSKTLNIIT